MKEKFLIKLEDIYKRYCELSDKLSDPAVISDTALWTKTAKDQSEIAEPSLKYEEYLSVIKRMTDAEQAVKTETDPEMKELLNEEISECAKTGESLKDELKILLLHIPCILQIFGKDPHAIPAGLGYAAIRIPDLHIHPALLKDRPLQHTV